ncbi:hypothetical protein BDZ94DRAFT_1254596 [Collybia nuda]|uniref:EthD domain-containing protein n=1 Tax=Collybia nuda TaxID=64659 RepID=A0A9P5YA95_9AGAR|nr:hypothetical protein BDZ94DRAFT_1254596 [Collybia nuda]
MTIRVTVLMRRRPDITREEFLKLWTSEHARIFASVKKVQEKIIRYSQYCILTPESERLAAAGLPVPEYDGAAEYHAESLDDIMEMLGDKEYQERVLSDEAKFLDRTSFQVLVGEEKVQHERP